MSSSILIFPNITKLVKFKGKYLRPTIDTDKSSYFILTDTSDNFQITNTDTTNKDINLEVFAVGGGGAGGYFNGNGGDGGMVVYKTIPVKSNETLAMSIGKGSFYIKDNNYNNGFLLKIYEGAVKDLFKPQNNYLMNMKPADLIAVGLNKKVERKVSKISSLKLLADNDIDLTVITNPIYVDECNNNPNSENCKSANNNWILYNKGYTIEITSLFFVPYDCSIQIDITASKYAILFFYSDNDIVKKDFDKDLINYSKFGNKYWVSVENGKKTFIRANLKKDEKYYFKIVHSQDNKLTLEENNFLVDIKIKADDNKQELQLIDDTYFKFNNGTENFGVFYSTATTIYNNENDNYLIKANGGTTGNRNPDSQKFGLGGCVLYDYNNRKAKICKDDGNGATGIKLPESYIKDLQELPLSNYNYGSGGGGAYWLLNGYGGKGGRDAGNGISFTSIPSLSKPTPSTGGGGGGNSFLANINEKKMDINKLSGADGIIIIKVNKIKEQVLIQTFANMSDLITVKSEVRNDLIRVINDKIELLYKDNKINSYDVATLTKVVNYSSYELENFGIIAKDLYIFFIILMNKLQDYIKLGEKDRLRFPMKFINNNGREAFFVENNSYVINFADYGNINFYYQDNLISSADKLTSLSKIFNYYKNEITYDKTIATTTTLNLNYNPALPATTNYNNFYIKMVINELLDPVKSVLFLENTYKNFFYYLTLLTNSIFHKSLYNYYSTTPNNPSMIRNIDDLTAIVKIFNSNFFDPIDKNSNEITDTKVSERTAYISQQEKYKEIYKKNVNDLNQSINITNFAVNKFKAKYQLNDKSRWFNILFIVVVILIVIVFISTYGYLEDNMRPLVVLILLITTIILIIGLWAKSAYDLSIFEDFTCAENSNDDCLNNRGGVNYRTALILPYYYLGKSNRTPIIIKPTKNSLTVDIFVYGSPSSFADGSGNLNYYEPNIDIYRNVSLPMTSSYHLYNDRIEKITYNNLDNTYDMTIHTGKPVRENLNRNSLYVFDCGNGSKDICTGATAKNLNDRKFSKYDNTGKLITNLQPTIADTNLTDNYDFNPPSDNPNNKYGLDYLSLNVCNEPFIVIKVLNDMSGTDIKTMNSAVASFKSEMSLLETNINLFLLNKNTKKIVDFTNRYERNNQRQFARTFETNKNIYNKNQQAFSILSRDIMINFYARLLVCIIIIIFLLCAIVYHYNRRDFFTIAIVGLILIIIATVWILIIIMRHQRINNDKYYFPKKIDINKLERQ